MLSIGGMSDWNGGQRHLGYLKHLARGRDHLFEAVDCIPYGSPSANTLVFL